MEFVIVEIASALETYRARALCAVNPTHVVEVLSVRIVGLQSEFFNSANRLHTIGSVGDHIARAVDDVEVATRLVNGLVFTFAYGQETRDEHTATDVLKLSVSEVLHGAARVVCVELDDISAFIAFEACARCLVLGIDDVAKLLVIVVVEEIFQLSLRSGVVASDERYRRYCHDCDDD